MQRVPGQMNYEAFIRDIPDFPKPGILFRDITPLLHQADVFRKSVDALAEPFHDAGVEGVAAVEARGFLFAAPMAIHLDVPLIPVRKPGKLPGETRSLRYELEYGTDQLEIHADAVRPRQRILVVDDLLATGGTVAAACQLLRHCDADIVGCTFLIELAGLGGRGRINAPHIHSLITYQEG